jgi:hypothetical protein
VYSEGELMIRWSFLAALVVGVFTVVPPAAADMPAWRLQARTPTSVPFGTVTVGGAASLARAPRENAVPLEQQGYVEEE